MKHDNATGWRSGAGLQVVADRSISGRPLRFLSFCVSCHSFIFHLCLVRVSKYISIGLTIGH